ncbi:hypothetical protein ES754_02590 [Psychrobacter frigidicola]|uniref:Periplasmic heavy metal sensor n=1 Tax=Psychrobacter frigidicola TaxID=45611 RepID=A0A5C7A439_9GAMM|nr:Spy/CpxP family protein refolding chaperone [Psychrobacter frigidicola]TXD97868.1 hypothetical protein ES754_02590 [Psychrobacter frigidicola]
MKKLLMTTVLAASTLFVVTTGANASPMTHSAASSSMQHKSGMKSHFSQLNLTADQEAKIKAIMQEKYGAQQGKRGDYKAERAQMQQQMQTLTDSKTLNTATVNRLADQQAAKTKQRFIDRVQTQHAISQVLTTEQRAKMAQLKTERQAKGRQHWESRKTNAK